MALAMRSRLSSVTLTVPLRYRETVGAETPASLATSLITGRVRPALLAILVSPVVVSCCYCVC